MKRFLIWFGAAMVLLGTFLFLLGPAHLVEQLATADLGIFALGLVSVGLALACWGEATRRLFVAFGAPISRRRALITYGAGAFGKQVLPMGNAGGPGVMAYAFNRERNLGYSRTLAVIVIAEFLSLVASLLIATVGIGILLLDTTRRGDLVWLGGGVVLVGVALFALTFAVWYRRKHVDRMVVRLTAAVTPLLQRVSPVTAARLNPDRVQANLSRYYDTLDLVAGDRPAMFYASGFSLVGWLFFALPLYTGALSVGVRLPLALAMVLVPAAGLATVFPLPGGLGGMEMALAGLLAVLASIEFATAGAVVVLFRLCSYWFFVLICGMAVTMATIDFRELSTTIADAEHRPAGDDNGNRS